MAIRDDLLAVRQRVAHAWGRQTFWPEYPRPCGPDSPVCVYGAAIVTLPPAQRDAVLALIYSRPTIQEFGSLTNWNDTHSKAEVLALLDNILESLP